MRGIVLLTIVAGVALISKWSPWRTHRSCEANLVILSDALVQYKAEHGRYPGSRRVLVGDYLDSLPKCPSLSLDTYRIASGPRAGYGPPQQSDYYLIRCTAQSHRALKPGFPAYDNVHGVMFAAPEAAK